ncbi:MAG: BrnT family toxin [Defluviitaleaceae bacterium]|nr:BrnT family toxin [Defluviitaleaceae bacterium]
MLELQGKFFDWDPAKEVINISKHGISFKEAASVFFDEQALEFDDIQHSQHEDRFLIIGRSRRLRLMVVCHCYRDENTVIRIISARKANKHEEEIYGGA